MDRKKNGQMDVWKENKNMKKQMDGWMDGQKKKQMDGWMDGQKKIDGYKNGRLDGLKKMDGRMEKKQMDCWMDRKKQMKKQMVGWIEKINGWVDVL